MPKPRPPFPAQQGLWSKPTVINNVETLVNVPLIILKGADWFAGPGVTPDPGPLTWNRPGFWEQAGYHNEGDPWKEERHAKRSLF